MSLKKQFQKVAQAGLLGMNVVAASVTRAAPNTDKTEAPDDVRITQQAETLPMEKSQEDLKKTLDFNNYLTGLSVYSSDRDGDLDKTERIAGFLGEQRIVGGYKQWIEFSVDISGFG